MFILPAVPSVLPFPAINPVLISIGPFAIRWYALAYIVGIIAGWFYARTIIASEKLWGGPAPITVTEFDDFIIWVTLGIILGGRIGYVLFYNLPHFTAHPFEIFELWNGGMSFHGGFLGCVVATVAFALRRGLPMLSLGDVTTAVAPIGLFLGRIANFINSELWGRPTDVPWAMIFPNGGPIPRHPSQALRGSARRPRPPHRAWVDRAPRRAEAARPRHRSLRRRLWRGAHCLRIFPRARPATRFSVGRTYDGYAALHPADSCGHRRDRLCIDAPTDREKWPMNFRRSKPKSAG